MSTLKKRLILATGGLAAIAGLALVGTGATSAIFNHSAADQSATFAAGTVSLSQAANAKTCTISNLAPGTAGDPTNSSLTAPAACTYTVSYDGSLAAWIYLNVSTSSTAATAGVPSDTTPGSRALFDGTQGGLQLSVTGPPGTSEGAANTVQTFQTGAVTCSGGTAETVQTCTSSAPNQLFNTAEDQGPAYGQYYVTNGWTGTFTVNSALPIWADNGYQGSSAQITLQASAVQYDNNHSGTCYRDACSVSTPFIESATASQGSSSVTVGYNMDVMWYDSHGATSPLPGFSVVDLTQSGATSNYSGVSPAPDTCPVTMVSGEPGNYPPSNPPGTNSLKITLGTCSNGSAIASGDRLDLTYADQGGAPIEQNGNSNNSAGSQTVDLIPVGS